MYSIILCPLYSILTALSSEGHGNVVPSIILVPAMCLHLRPGNCFLSGPRFI